jgi:hypothetical protein
MAGLTIAAFLAACEPKLVPISPMETGQLGMYRSVSLRTTGGSSIKILKARWEAGRISGFDDKGNPVAIEASEIRALTAMETKGDPLLIGLFACALAIEVGLAIGAATAPAPPPVTYESCPLLYSFDGSRYVLEAEPYGGAVSAGLARTEWIPLDLPAAVGGEYRLRMTNELSETEHVDEIKLLAVDHLPGLDVIPDASGRLHTVSAPQPPISAMDDRGHDVLEALAGLDGRFWEAAFDPGAPVPDKGGLRRSLTLELPKPAGAASIKLIAEAWTTKEGSLAAKEYLELMGPGLDAFFAEVDARGPALFKLLAWYAREELYLLKAWVETPAGWSPRAVIYGGGPFAAKPKAYVLDVHDVPGDIVRVRLEPPAGFWRFDGFAVDASEDQPLEVREIAPFSAKDAEGRGFEAELAAADGLKLVMPAGHPAVDLRFAVPALRPGLARSLVLKAGGWYAPHFSRAGEPRPELFERILTEPGAALRLTQDGWRARR